MNEGKYPCPCCGYYAFSEKPPGTSLFCEICFWDDIPINQYWECSYTEAICVAQKNFLQFGASSPEFINIVRRPTSADQRLANWKPMLQRIEDERKALILDIDEAFRYVELSDGVSLHEADVIDGYGSTDERKRARLLDTERSWQGISDDKLRKFLWGPFSFMEDKGMRFYLPAFMTYSLKRCGCDDYVVFCIERILKQNDNFFTSDQLRVMIRYGLYSEYSSGLISRADRFIKRAKRDAGVIWNDELLNPYKV